jgi:uncharacterized protein (TIGR02598 family)
MKLQCRHTSFSLMEVTIALGVAAICLIGIFGLLPVGLQTDQNATEQSRALGISSVVIADLRATPGSGSGTSPQLGISIPALSATSVSAAPLYFNSEGQSSTSLISQSRYRVSITFPANSTGGRVATWVSLKITWPAGASPTDATGALQTFTALDRN